MSTKVKADESGSTAPQPERGYIGRVGCPDCSTEFQKEGEYREHYRREHTGTEGAEPVSDTAKHYQRAVGTYRELGTYSNGAVALARPDKYNWYQHSEGSCPPVTPSWWGRAHPLTVEAPALPGGISRSMYATANYSAPEAIGRAPCSGVSCVGINGEWHNTDKDKRWHTEDGGSPLPGYNDIEAIALYSDFDIKDERAERPLSERDREVMNECLLAFCATMGDDLAGDRDAVFLLDSGGGAYPMLSPSVTAPIGDEFSGDERGRLFEELCRRFKRWAENLVTRMKNAWEPVAGLIDPDSVMNNNRLYKVPLSIHKSMDVVVTPMNPRDPKYNVTRTGDVDRKLVRDAEQWASDLTADEYRDSVDQLIAALWPEKHQEAENWKEALRAWLEEEAERAATQRERQQRASERRKERDRSLGEIEVTDDIRDVYDAVEAIDVKDVARELTSEWTDSRDPPRFNPPYRDSETGESCFVDKDKFVDVSGSDVDGGDAVMLVALADGIISPGDGYPSGGDYRSALRSLRELGHHVPELRGGPESRAVLLPRDVSPPNDDAPEGLEREAVWERTKETLKTEFTTRGGSLVNGLMTTGKSHGTVLATAETPEDVTVSMFTVRGRKEQYDDLKEKAEDADLSVETLPSAPRDCPCFNGDCGETVKKRVWSWYNAGATAGEIHRNYEERTGEEIPCSEDGCPYKRALDRINYENVDLILGHHTHAYADRPVNGRAVAIDEFDPSAFITTFGDGDDVDAPLKASVESYLQQHDALPFGGLSDLISERNARAGKRARRVMGIMAMEKARIGGDETDTPALKTEDDGERPQKRASKRGATRSDLAAIMRDGSLPYQGIHALAPAVVYTLLTSDKLGNGYERAELPGGMTAVYDRSNDELHLLNPPDLRYAATTVCLDGTPTAELWETALGIPLDERQVMNDDERRGYLARTLKHRYVQISEARKPYSSGKWVNEDQDAAICKEIAQKHGREPPIISSQKALQQYDEGFPARIPTDDDGARSLYYGNLLGSNKAKDESLGAVIGSPNFGDEFVKKWGAFCGEAVTAEREKDGGGSVEYSGIGAKIARHMSENQVLQAVMRFGRSPEAGGAVVYVVTRCLPDWVPRLKAPGATGVYGDGSGMSQVWDAVQKLDSERGEFARRDIDPLVEASESTVRRKLRTLAEKGALSREKRRGRYHYELNDGDNFNDLGAVNLTPEISEGEAPEIEATSSVSLDEIAAAD